MSDRSSIVLYAPEFDNTGMRLKTVAEQVGFRENIVVVQEMQALFQILKAPMSRIMAAIILASRDQDLMELMAVKELLLRLPVILILPDQQKETITKGHFLRPRFLTYSDSDFSDVRAVCLKMVGRDNGVWH